MSQIFKRMLGWFPTSRSELRELPSSPTLSQLADYVATLKSDLVSSSLLQPPAASVPAFTVDPAITGTALVGETLTCDSGTYDGYPSPTLTRQWKRNGINIAGATNATYVLQSADNGKEITCLVTITNTGGSDTATTNAIGPILSDWLPSDISSNARWFLADTGVTSSNSSTFYSWTNKRDNRNWGDWIGRDSVFTYVDGASRDKLIMYGGWSNANQTSWNNQFLTNEIWMSGDRGVTWELIDTDSTSTTTRPSKRHLAAKCYATFDGVDYVYLMGGKLDVSGGPQTPQTVDVWRKVLGDPTSGWERMTANAGVGARDNMFMGELNGVLYAGGGYTGVGNTIGSGLGVQRDLWKSEDEGATWTLVTATAPWGPTCACGQHMLKKNNKLWIFGGWEATTAFGEYTARNDVWTYDGTNFVEVLADGNSQFPPRFYHNVEIDSLGNFVIIGGHDIDGDNVTDNGFYSADGVTWTELPTKPHGNVHACSLWSIGSELVACNGYTTPTSPLFTLNVWSLTNYTAPRVDSWAGQGVGSLTLSASSTARPYLVTGALATGTKTIYFDASQYMNLGISDSFSGSGSILIAGRFAHFATGRQAIVGSASNVQFGIQGTGPYATDSSSDSVMARSHSRFIQSGDLRCIALTMDGSECKMRVDGDLLETDGESFSLSSWSRVGGGYTATADNFKGHIVAIAIIPDAIATKDDFMEFQSWAFSKAGLFQEDYAEVTTIAPDQLLLQDGKLAHYTVEEDAAKTHLLRDHSVDYRSGTAIPGFAPQNCLTGNGTDYATVAFGSYRPGVATGAMTVEFSMKTPATISSRGVMCSFDSPNNIFHWVIQLAANGKLNWYNRTHISGAVASNATLTADTWYRIKYVRTGSTGNWTIALYINGVLDGTTTGVTADPSAAAGVAYLMHTAGAFTRFNGSLSDVRFTHDGHKWYLPLIEGSRPNLYCHRSDGLLLTQSVLTDLSLWAGVKTEPASMAANWLLQFGGKLELGQSTVLPAYLDMISVGGSSTDDQKPDFFASRFHNGTINCDPLSLGSVGLGLESALTPTTERDTASSGKRRRRVFNSRVDRLAAKATSMASSTANEYFRD